MDLKPILLKIFFICTLTCIFSPLQSKTPDNENQKIEKRLVLQKRYRARAWCLVPWKKSYYPAEILDLKKKSVSVKIFDNALPLDEWPKKTFSIKEIQPMPFQKFSTEEALITSLKNSNILRTPLVEDAFRKIQRHWFCPNNPYFDSSIDIGCGMCISAPHMHIWALELFKDRFAKAQSILDVGCGTGYITAISAFLAPQANVTGIEIFELLKTSSQHTCDNHLPSNITKRIHWDTVNGEKGYLENAPYDIIHVGFMCKQIPQALIDQLSPGGRLVIPVGDRISTYDPSLLSGDLMVVDKEESGSIKIHKLFSCSFVPSQASGS